MSKNVRERLMEKFGLQKQNASMLIEVYAKRHNGKVNIREIEKDIEKITNDMVYNLGNIYRDYDIKHEILECGKDRQEEAIMSLLSEEQQQIAQSYLENRYYKTVDNWSYTFYQACQAKLLEILKGDIKSYRSFVEKLPHKNIYKVARTFAIENEVANFLAEKGTLADFEKFMTDAQPTRKNKIEIKGSSKNVSKKIFEQMKKQKQNKETIYFEKASIMKGLLTIDINKKLTDEEKEQLKNLFIEYAIKGGDNGIFIRLAKTEIPDINNVLKEYLEMGTDTKWKERKKFLDAKVESLMKQKISDEYNKIITLLENQNEEKELTTGQIMNILDQSQLSSELVEDMTIQHDSKNQKTKLIISLHHPIILGNTIEIEIDGTKLNQIIEDANKKEKIKANEKLEEFAQLGIGEVKISGNRKPYNPEDIIGYIGEEENSPCLIGGKLSEDDGLTDLRVVCSYKTICNMKYLQEDKAIMTPEQTEKFNNKAEILQVKKHRYGYNTSDGYRSCDVYDFELNGEQYHIREADWGNGGCYTIIWKGDEPNNPKEAIGLSSSRSEWARMQRGVSEESVIKLISENPHRFEKYYQETAKLAIMGCGNFPTSHIEDFCKNIMKMDTETELKKLSKQEEQYGFAEELVNLARNKTELENQEKEAKELLAKYEKLDQKKGTAISDQ